MMTEASSRVRWTPVRRLTGVEVGLRVTVEGSRGRLESGWVASRRMLFPLRPLGTEVDAWLTGLEHHHDTRLGFSDDTHLGLSHQVDHVWVDAASGTGSVQFKDPLWASACPLSSEHAAVASRIASGSQMSDLRADEPLHVLLEAAGTSLEASLRSLGICGVLA